MIHRLEDIFGAMILVLVVIGIILVAIDEYFRGGSRHVTAKWQKKRELPRNPLVPALNNHKNQKFIDRKKEKSKNICREKVKVDD